MTNNLKCKNCKPPIRHPGCHATCQNYLSWKEEHDQEAKAERESKWLSNLGKPIKPKRKRKK